MPGGFVTPDSNNTTVLAFRINDPFGCIIETIKIGNIGTMNNSSGLSNIKIWYDAGGVNNQWDTNDIQINGNGLWNPTTDTWNFTELSIPSTNIVATINVAYTAVSGSTFQAIINSSNVINTNGNYNFYPIINANEITILISPPNKSTEFNAAVVSTNQINLLWDDLSIETSYTLFRNTANDTNNLTNIVGLSADVTNYNDIGLDPDTTYYYWVKGYNTGGSLGFSSVVSNTTFPLPPGKPTGLDATAISKNQINLLWNDLSTETFYILFRSVKNNTNAAKIVSKLSVNNTYYKDTLLEPDTTYYYWIKACNPGGSSPFSEMAYATTEPLVPEKLLMKIYNNKVECYNKDAGEEAILHFEISEKEIDEQGVVDVKISIYDVNSELVDTPVNDKYIIGFHDEPWQACEKAGSGVYIVVFEIGEEKQIMKIMVVK